MAAGSLKSRYLMFLVSSIMIVGGGIGAILYYLFPAFYPPGNWYGAILLFFLCVEAIIIHVVDKGSQTLSAHKQVNLLMAIKGCKIFLSVLFIGIYAWVEKEGIKNFALLCALFYLIYIMLELPFYAAIERRIKEKKNE